MALPRLSSGGKNYDPRKPRKPRKPTITPARPQDYGQGITADSLAKQYGDQPPAKPVKPYTTPQDVSWQDQPYFDTQAGIDRNLANTKTSLMQGGNALGAEYGIQFDRDPNDPLQASNFRIAENVDVTNPFSRAALLKRSYQQAQRSARGNIDPGAGYLQAKLNQTTFGYEAGKDSLLKDFGGRYGGLYQQWLSGQGTATQQGLDNTGQAQARNQNQPAAAQSFKPIPIKDATAAGLTFKQEGGRFVVYDSRGQKIPGATIHIKGGKHYVTVPR